MRQSLDNRTQSLEVDMRLSHLERDLWRPSREEAYLSHIWWRRSRGQYCNIGPRRRASLHKSSPCSTQINTPASHRCFLQAGCPSCHPTNSVKALKAHCCCHLLNNRGSHQIFPLLHSGMGDTPKTCPIYWGIWTPT